jgi:hypothetical protein
VVFGELAGAGRDLNARWRGRALVGVGCLLLGRCGSGWCRRIGGQLVGGADQAQRGAHRHVLPDLHQRPQEHPGAVGDELARHLG